MMMMMMVMVYIYNSITYAYCYLLNFSFSFQWHIEEKQAVQKLNAKAPIHIQQQRTDRMGENAEIVSEENKNEFDVDEEKA